MVAQQSTGTIIQFARHLRSVYGATGEVVEDAESKGFQLENVLPVMPRRHFGDFVINVFYVVISLRRNFHVNKLKRSVLY